MSNREYVSKTTLQDAAQANGNGVECDVAGMSRLGVQVIGTFVANVNFEACIDPAMGWYGLPLTPVAGGATAAGAATTGHWVASVAGLARVRARVSDYASGAVTVLALATTAEF